MSESDVTFVGDFTPDERALLSKQFSRCRFELIRRAAGDPTCAIFTWSAPGIGRSRGPAPLRSVPAAAVYVLRRAELTRVRTPDELERVFGESLGEISLPGLSRPNPVWEGAKEALRGLFPWR